MVVEAKNKIPEGWQEGSLSCFANPIAKRFPKNSSPYLEIGDIDVISKNYKTKDKPAPGVCLAVDCGDVLISKVRPTRGAIIKVKDSLYVSPAFSVLRACGDDNYLYYALSRQKFVNYLGTRETGTTYPSCDDRDIFDYNTVFPIKIEEQQKIAEILTTLDNAIEKTDAIIEKNKRIKQGLMQDLFRYGIDEQGNIRSEKTHKFKTVKIGNQEMRIPDEWEVKTIMEITNNEKFAIVDGPFGSNLKTEHYKTSGIPIIQSGFVTSGEFYAEKYLYVDKQKFFAEIRSKVVPGDIVMAKIGAQCGTCSILPENHEVGILAGNCLKISVGKNCSNIFLDTLLKYYYKNGRLFLIITTTAQPAVNMSSLKEFQIIKPPLNEQERIIELLNFSTVSIKKEIIYKQKLLSLKRGLMEDLLTGTMRVNSLMTN